MAIWRHTSSRLENGSRSQIMPSWVLFARTTIFALLILSFLLAGSRNFDWCRSNLCIIHHHHWARVRPIPSKLTFIYLCVTTIPQEPLGSLRKSQSGIRRGSRKRRARTGGVAYLLGIKPFPRIDNEKASINVATLAVRSHDHGNLTRFQSTISSHYGPMGQKGV